MERKEALETLEAIESSVAELCRIQASRPVPAGSGDAAERRRDAAACLAMLGELNRLEALVQALKVYLTVQYAAAERALKTRTAAAGGADDMQDLAIRLRSATAKLPVLSGGL